MARVPPSRRVSALVSPQVWAGLSDDERIAVRVIDQHLAFRFAQTEHEPLEEIDGERSGVFLTPKHVQRLLRQLRYRKTGEKFARTVITTVQRLGIVEDTGEVKKPRRSRQSIAAAKKFQGGQISTEGGRDAQPSLEHSYWWRVYRVVPLALVERQHRALRAYDSGHVPDLPQWTACLSALLRCQGLISTRRRPSEFSPRSVQWVFASSGPP